MASSKASEPAVVLIILKLAFIARSPSIVIDKVFPILRVESCSRFRKTFFGSMLPLAKITFPLEALAGSLKATIRPLIVRASESAAVITIGIVSFIGSCPLFFVFPRRIKHQFDLALRKLARVLLRFRVGMRPNQNVQRWLNLQNPA